jgi:predicted Zn finger-like uncharacterized protein
MIIVCPSCQARYKFDESKLSGRPRARTRCAKCGGAIDIVNPALETAPRPAAPAPPPPPPAAVTQAPPAFEQAPSPFQDEERTAATASDTDRGGGNLTGRELQAMLELPRDKRFSLAVIQGEATGQIFQIQKVRTVLGRAGADVNLDDPEASRQHAVLEILGDRAMLRDLGSTNGTWVDNARIEQEVLSNQMEFRIGSHVVMFIITDVD